MHIKRVVTMWWKC